jgi:hypothetical protein
MDFLTFAFLFFVLPVLLVYISLKAVEKRKGRVVRPSGVEIVKLF